MTNRVRSLPFDDPHTHYLGGHPSVEGAMVTTPAAAAASKTTPTTRTMITGTHHQCDDWQHPQRPGNDGGGGSYPYYLVPFVCLEAIIFDFISWCDLVPT